MPTTPDDDAPASNAPLITRRRLLGAAAAGSAALAVSGTQIGQAAAALAPVRGVPGDPASSGIEHVVVVMMENRSFDHMLGWLPGAKGRQAGLTYLDNAGVAHKTWHLDTFDGLAYHDPSHSYAGGRVEWNNGANDGWLKAGSNDIFSIGYYTRKDLDFYGYAARYWTVCDHFFASTMGPTYPNRFYMHAAQTDRASNTYDVSVLPTIWDSLADAGLEGRYYYNDFPFTALWGGTLAGISKPYPEFLTAAAAGTLPEVSFIDPRFLTLPAGNQNDDHPHADIRRGQFFLNSVYEAVSSSPNWENTVLVITYDEWGGFFDHVPPAVAPDANPDMGLRGFRIPTMVISPLARRYYVDHRTYDPTSILKMIEWRWGLPTLSPRDAAARNLAEVLDFRHAANLTAPRWDVPDIDAVPAGQDVAAAARTSAAPAAELAAEREAHFAEMATLRQMAVDYGFAVPPLG